MLLEQVRQMEIGDLVIYKGEGRRITSIILASSTSPQFLLADSTDGAISYRLVGVMRDSDLRHEAGENMTGRFDLSTKQVMRGYP